MTIIDSWKNSKTVSHKQLELNIQELNNYPKHWTYFIHFMDQLIKEYKCKTVLDVAFGSGIYSKLCEKHYPNISYKGVDYSPEAVKIANNTWGNKFELKDYTELTSEYIYNFDVINVCALHNILPNGDDVMEFFLKLQPKFLILGKIQVTDKESYHTQYLAWNEIMTYSYYHNFNNLKNMFKKYNYKVLCDNSPIPSEYLLIKI